MEHLNNRRRMAPMAYVSQEHGAETVLAETSASAPCALIDLQAEIVAARRAGRALSIALLQIQRQGARRSAEREREATRRVMQIVSKNLRHTDKCGFLGPLEILAILPGADERGSAIAFGRLRSSSFDKIAASLNLQVLIELAQLGANEACAVAFLDRVRGVAQKRAAQESV